MPYSDREVKSKLRKLARQGRLLDTAFQTFQRAVYEDAPPDQVAALRITFMAGAAELFAVMNAGLDDEDGETAGDLIFMRGWVQELETFHARTIEALMAAEAGNKPS